jgi:Ser/Thr protein kinase RdoA (MazF antagonist)
MQVHSLHSLLRPDELATIAGRTFGVGKVTACRLQRSFINDTYRLEASGRIWFLRVTPLGWRSPSEVAAELAFVRALGKAGAPVIESVALTDGSGEVLELNAPEGTRAAVLFVAAPGAEPVFGTGPESLATARAYGRISAKLHAVADQLPPIAGRQAIDGAAVLHRPLAVIGAQASTPKQRDWLVGLGEQLAPVVADTRLTIGFAHGDLNTANILFDGEHATVIDFDCCGQGWRANDIAAFARGVTLSRLPGADAKALISAQLAGYAEVLPIHPADARAIPAFLLVQRLWMASLHYERVDRFGLANFGPAYTDRLFAWLHAWAGVLDVADNWLEEIAPSKGAER